MLLLLVEPPLLDGVKVLLLLVEELLKRGELDVLLTEVAFPRLRTTPDLVKLPPLVAGLKVDLRPLTDVRAFLLLPAA